MAPFLESIDKSYSDYEEKLQMIQRATSISSNELYKANQQLNKETESQRKILGALSRAVHFMESSTHHTTNGQLGFDPHKLVENIENQTNKIIEITEEKNHLLHNLEQQNESLNNYAHMVSHDLKSPIRNIHSLVSWVFQDEQDTFKAQSKSNIDLIFQNLGKMDSLIDGILRHATIDALEEELIEVDLNQLIEEIVRTIYVPNNTTIETARQLPILHTGKYRIEQLFKNLLTNAVTATEGEKTGHIVIDVEDKGDKWQFSVSDNGKGIPQYLQHGIFDMFKKLENDANATGIGLALVKKIINYYKGDIWLASEEGQGTTFFFTIKTKI